jgi:hypothetical protein
MLTLILIFAGFVILAVISAIIDALTRRTVVLCSAERYELEKCLNRFLDQQPLKDEIEGLRYCAKQWQAAVDRASWDGEGTTTLKAQRRWYGAAVKLVLGRIAIGQPLNQRENFNYFNLKALAGSLIRQAHESVQPAMLQEFHSAIAFGAMIGKLPIVDG